MVEFVKVDAENEVTELHIDDGCPACGGELQIRKSPGNTAGYCRQCQMLSRPRVVMNLGGLQVMHRTAAA